MNIFLFSRPGAYRAMEGARVRGLSKPSMLNYLMEGNLKINVSNMPIGD